MDILTKQGPKLLFYSPDATQKLIKELIVKILALSKSSNLMYKYEKLIKIYINQEKYLEELLDFIMLKDDDCSSIVIHRRIEVCLEQINRSNNYLANSEKIIEILKNKKYNAKYDQNYLLMLFKTHNFMNGIIVLSEIMQLRQELLTIYMETHNFDKIMNICTNYGGVDNNNFWIQALNFFVKQDGQNTESYVKTILDNVINNDIICPLSVMEILKNKKDIKFEFIRPYITKIIEKEYNSINTDKTEYDVIEEKSKKYNNEIIEMKSKGTQFSVFKCVCCKQPTSNLNVVPIVFFLCNHAYHLHCLNNEISETKEDEESNHCPECRNRSHQISQRIIQSEEKANNNDFRMELDNKPKKFDLIAKYLGMGLFKSS